MSGHSPWSPSSHSNNSMVSDAESSRASSSFQEGEQAYTPEQQQQQVVLSGAQEDDMTPAFQEVLQAGRRELHLQLSPASTIASELGGPPLVHQEATQGFDATMDVASMDIDAHLEHIFPNEELTELVREMLEPTTPVSLLSSLADMQEVPGQTLEEFRATHRRGMRFFRQEVLDADFTRAQFARLRTMLGAQLYGQFRMERRRNRDMVAASRASHWQQRRRQRLSDANAQLRRQLAALNCAQARLYALGGIYSATDALFLEP